MLRKWGYQLIQSVNITCDGNPSYKERPPVIKKLNPYREYLLQRVKSAHPLKLPAAVLLREIQRQGYLGGLTQLRLYIRSLKPVCLPEKEIRVETLSGRQMQVDWIEFRKGKEFLAAFVATLGFSRTSYVHFVTNERLGTLIECHKQAFGYFGGVPYEALYV